MVGQAAEQQSRLPAPEPGDLEAGAGRAQPAEQLDPPRLVEMRAHRFSRLSPRTHCPMLAADDPMPIMAVFCSPGAGNSSEPPGPGVRTTIRAAGHAVALG